MAISIELPKFIKITHTLIIIELLRAICFLGTIEVIVNAYSELNENLIHNNPLRRILSFHPSNLELNPLILNLPVRNKLLKPNINPFIFQLHKSNRDFEINPSVLNYSELNCTNSESLSRMQKLHKIRDELNISGYCNDFTRRNTTISDFRIAFKSLENGTVVPSTPFVITGRIKNIRNNFHFIDIEDFTGRIQLYLPKEEEESDNKLCNRILLKYLDRGDIISVIGLPMRTKLGELSLRCHKIELLSKALLPPPDKYSGLKDFNYRYRSREIDIMSNFESMKVLRDRFVIISKIRELMKQMDFMEVETPILQNFPGGASAKPFALYKNKYLRISPELYLKRLIVGGLFPKIFELNRSFRDEGMSPWHHPEFTTLEAYHSFSNYLEAMETTEKLIFGLTHGLKDNGCILYHGTELNLNPPWPRRTMLSLVQQYTGLNFLDVTYDEALKKAQELIPHTNFTNLSSWGAVLECFFDNFVQNQLIQPIHVTEHPSDISPLSRSFDNDPRFSERFETFIYGKEIANGYSELSDPIEQQNRFMKQIEKSQNLNSEIDYDFIKSLKAGLPPTSGLGIGIDRLVMILTNASSIKDVIPFPIMRSAYDEKST